MRVWVIIPTHNEAQAIGRVPADPPASLVTQVIVVDSNSTDGTQDAARKMGAQVIQESRRGYGRACLTGLAGLIRLLYGVKLSDRGPFRAARAEVLNALALKEATYGWAVEMILNGAIAGYGVVEVPVSYYPRIGKSKISGTVKGTFGAGWFILTCIVRYSFRRRRAGAQRLA